MRKQKGITLIALIITIIIMMILVGVTVTVAIKGELFDKAKQAATGMTMAQIQEKAEMVKYTVFIETESGSNTVIGTKAEYIKRLATEFGVTDNEIKGNKVIVADGKYDIIVKNSNLDIEVVEHSDYIDKSSIISLEFDDENIVENDKIYGIILSTNLKGNIDKVSYASQEFEKNSENKEELTHEEAVMAYLSQQVSDMKGTETKIETSDQYFIESLNYLANEKDVATHDTLDDWFDDSNFPTGIEELFGLEEGTGEKIKNRSDLYNAIMRNTDFTVEATEQQIIEYVYTNIILPEQEKEENEQKSNYETEYLENTTDMDLYVIHNGKEKKIQEDIDLETAIMQNYIINENGEYIIVLKNKDIEVASEILEINNIEKDNPYVLTEEQAEGIWYVRDDYGLLMWYEGTDTSVVIPMYVGTTKIVQVGNSAVSGTSVDEINGILEEVIIPSSVTSIGYRAFENSKNLRNVTISDSVTLISTEAFKGCTSLDNVVIPNSVTTISGSTFAGCTSLTKITIPDLVTSIGNYAFQGCTSLKEIIIPNLVTSIGQYAFSNCTSLENITIGNSVTSIDDHAFGGCTSLNNIIIPNSVNTLGDRVFWECTSLTSVTLSNSIQSIGTWTFRGCTNLKQITIPNSVTSIKSNAFLGCSDITITFEKGENQVPEGFPWGASNATLIDLNDTTTE